MHNRSADSKIPRFQDSRLRRPVTPKWTHSKIARLQDSRLRWSVTQKWTHSPRFQDSKIPRFAAQQCDRRRSRDRRAVNRSRFQITDSQVRVGQPKSDSRLADSKIPRPRCATLRSAVPANSRFQIPACLSLLLPGRTHRLQIADSMIQDLLVS